MYEMCSYKSYKYYPEEKISCISSSQTQIFYMLSNPTIVIDILCYQEATMDIYKCTMFQQKQSVRPTKIILFPSIFSDV